MTFYNIIYINVLCDHAKLFIYINWIQYIIKLLYIMIHILYYHLYCWL